MKRARDFVALAGALGLAFLMMMWPDTALEAAQGAMYTWVKSVAPALFPFLTLLPALTSPAAREMYERALGWAMRPLFGLSGRAAPALLIGLMAGSPAGARAAARVADGLDARQARRLGLMCAGVSPMYLIGGVGAALLGEARVGVHLALSQAAAQLLLGALLRGGRGGAVASVDPAADEEKPVRAAVAAVLQVCGYMVLFSVGAALVARLAGRTAGDAALYVLDMPSGLARAGERGAALWMVAAIAGFGGVCIGAQNMAHLRQLGVRWRDYLAARGFVAAVCALTTAARFPRRGAAVAAMARARGTTLEISTLAALALLLPALLALARRKSNS